MSSGTADLPPPGGARRPTASDGSSDDEPLMKMKTAHAETPNKKENASLRSNGTNKNAGLNADHSSDDEPLSKIGKVSSKDAKKSLPPKKSVDTKASDDFADNKPPIKMKTTFAEKPETKENTSSRSNGANNKDTDDASDNEPLIKTTKKSPRAAKKSVDTKKKDSSVDDSLDDEPLSEIARKLKSRRQRTAPVRNAAPVIKSKRSAARKKVQYAEFSSDSSDDEPLVAIKRKRTTAAEEQRIPANNRKTNPKDKSLNDRSSDDDNEPLVNLVKNKKKPVKKNTKRTRAPRRSASKKRQGLSDESSEDEPLINLVKKNHTDKQTKTRSKTEAVKRRDTTPKRPRKMHESDLSSNSSDDGPLIDASKHPQVTKILRIILERCDGEDAGPTGKLNKSKTETLIAEEPTKEKLEESSEDE